MSIEYSAIIKAVMSLTKEERQKAMSQDFLTDDEKREIRKLVKEEARK